MWSHRGPEFYNNYSTPPPHNIFWMGHKTWRHYHSRFAWLNSAISIPILLNFMSVQRVLLNEFSLSVFTKEADISIRVHMKRCPPHTVSKLVKDSVSNPGVWQSTIHLCSAIQSFVTLVCIRLGNYIAENIFVINYINKWIHTKVKTLQVICINNLSCTCRGMSAIFMATLRQSLFFPVAQESPVSQDLLIFGASQSHTHTHTHTHHIL
jgi:hypothetical protein